MTRRFAWVGACLVAVCVGGTPFVYRSLVSVKYRNLRVVEPGTLYRSGQMSVEGLAKTVRDHGIKTVICLRDVRDDGKPAPDKGEAEWCAANGVEHVVLTPALWEAPPGSRDDTPPIEPNLRAFLKLTTDASKTPALVHCFAGIHRTGGYVAFYRIEVQGWSAEEALREMQSMGTPRTTFDGEIAGYLRGYDRGRLRPVRKVDSPATR